METERPNGPVRVTKPDIVRVDTDGLLVPMHTVDGERQILVVHIPTLGYAIPLWRSRSAMLAALRTIFPAIRDNPPEAEALRDKDKIVAIAKQHGMSIIVDLTALAPGEWRYGRIVWD
jgi:hypothetical protein